MLERIKKLKQAIIIERNEELSRYESLAKSQTIKERIQAGVTLYPIEFLNEGFTIFEDLQLSFKYNDLQDPFQFSSNGKVQLFSGNSDITIEGVIHKIKNNTITIQLGDNDIPEWIKSGKLGLNALPDTRTSDIQIQTLEKIEAGELRIAKAFYENGGKEDFSISPIAFEHLNDSQNLAVSAISSNNPFHIIHGPPGTGKTRTLVQAILQMVSEGKKVLVTAPSNAAVDHITYELSKQHPKVLRMGNSFKISEVVLPLTLKERTFKNPLMDVVKRLKKDAETIRKKAFKYKRNFGKEEYKERKQLRSELRTIRRDIRGIEQEIGFNQIDSSQIITGTFIGLQDKRLGKVDFDAVFVDEAGQALEPSIWSVAHYAPKLFLAGDPLQLPPTIFTPKAKKLGLHISLIENGIALKIPTTLLNVQYRMHAQIMQFSNIQFYKNLLSADNTVKDHTLNEEPHAPFEFIDTAGCGYDEINDENGGIHNPGEIELIQKRLTAFESDISSIGIISPYRKQVNSIKETITQHISNTQTIDSFQGQERDLIIVSLVRSNENAIIGFLKDYRRMNVAMTRARKKLIIIGDSATIGGDTFYQDLLDYVEKNGAYRSAWEFMA